jgi:hypothetical protein
MAYNDDIPKPNESGKDSQPKILANFQDIKTYFDVDHEALTGLGGDEGKHKFAHFPELAELPPYTQYNIDMFAKLNSINAAPDIFLKINESEKESDIRSLNIASFPDATMPTNVVEFFTLPCGIMVKFVTSTINMKITSGNFKVIQVATTNVTQPKFKNLYFVATYPLLNTFLNKRILVTTELMVTAAKFDRDDEQRIVVNIFNAAGSDLLSGELRLTLMLIGTYDTTTT